MSLTFDQLIANIDSKQLDQQIQQKQTFVHDQQLKLLQQMDQKISTIILVKKRKLDYNAYTHAAARLKLFLTSAKHLIQVYFDLLQDQQKLLLYNLTDIKDLVSKIRFCLFRSVHNMNRILIKQNQQTQNQFKTLQNQFNQQGNNNKKSNPQKKRKKRKKGKNSKMSIQQTGCMYKWILQNFDNPYPSQQQKQLLSTHSKISISKVNYWFINMRQRTLKKLMTGQNSGYGKKKRSERASSEKEELNSDDEEPNLEMILDESAPEQEDDDSS